MDIKTMENIGRQMQSHIAACVKLAGELSRTKDRALTPTEQEFIAETAKLSLAMIQGALTNMGGES